MPSLWRARNPRGFSLFFFHIRLCLEAVCQPVARRTINIVQKKTRMAVVLACEYCSQCLERLLHDARVTHANTRSWMNFGYNALMNDSSIIDDSSKDDNTSGEENTTKLKTCAKCGEKIEGKFLLRALDQFWHEECLKCSYCSTQLTELSLKFYFKRDLMLCKRDYIRWGLFRCLK